MACRLIFIALKEVMTMNRRYPLLIFILSVICMFTVHLQAQVMGDSEEAVKYALERTDEMLDRAEDVIESANNPQAAISYEYARKLQNQAWEKFNLKTRAGFAAALMLTVSAREQLRSALGNTNRTEQGEGMVQRILERTQDLLDRAGQLAGSSNDRNLNSIYEAARDNMNRAWEFYRKGEYRPALKLADQVEKSAQRILNRERENSGEEGNFERRRENVERVISKAEQNIDDGSTVARSFLDQAKEALRLADDLYGRQQYGAAMQALQRARDLALRAAQESSGLGGRERLEQRQERLRHQAEVLGEKLSSLSGAQAEAARKLVNQAFEQLDLARNLINSGQLEKGIAALQAAQIALRQAESYIH